MHEMALAEGILAVALEAANGDAVRRIRLRIGTLQRVVPDSLQFCFQLAAQDTPAADALLELEEIAARARCRRCSAETVLESATFNCSVCGAAEIDVVSGDEVLIDAVELDGGWRHNPAAQGEARRSVGVPASHLEEHAREDAERERAASTRPATT